MRTAVELARWGPYVAIAVGIAAACVSIAVTLLFGRVLTPVQRGSLVVGWLLLVTVAATYQAAFAVAFPETALEEGVIAPDDARRFVPSLAMPSTSPLGVRLFGVLYLCGCLVGLAVGVGLLVLLHW